MHELYKKHRPKKLEAIVGQPAAVKMLTSMIEKNRVDHCMLFAGPSGCGKTTLARILSKKLHCAKGDFQEINCADFRGIDMVRGIRRRMNLKAFNNGCRIWLIDEAHQLSKDAQDAFLKIMEDTPEHVYFFLATTDPKKLIATIRNRATTVVVKLLSPVSLAELVEGVLVAEGRAIVAEVRDKLVTVAEGSARKALVLLGQVLELEDDGDQLEVLSSAIGEKEGIEIARALLNPRTTWPDMAKIIKSVTEEPEDLRWMVLGYMNAVILGGGKMAPRASSLIDLFRDNWYDCKKSGLISACYDAIANK